MDELKKSIEATEAEEARLAEEAKANEAKELETTDESDPSAEDQQDKQEDKQEDDKQEEDKKPTTGSDRLDKRLTANLERMLRGATAPEQGNEEAYKPLDYAKAPEDGFSTEQLEEDRRQYAEYLASKAARSSNDVGEQRQFLTNLELDKDRVEARYPKLDENSEDFDPILTDAINKWYQASVGFDAKKGRVGNTNIRYRDFVDTAMAVSERIAEEKQAESAKNVAKQASRTGLRPSGSVQKPHSLDFSKISDMSEAEWEKNKAAYYKSVQDRL
jgi:hypothetical protein